MTDFITTAQVDAILGPAWAPDEDKPRFTMMSNAWLSERIRQEFWVVPDEIVQAGALIAESAAAGDVYAAQDRETTSESVRAGPVTVTETFREGSSALTTHERFALALIRPWVSGSQIRLVRG